MLKLFCWARLSCLPEGSLHAGRTCPCLCTCLTVQQVQWPVYASSRIGLVLMLPEWPSPCRSGPQASTPAIPHVALSLKQTTLRAAAGLLPARRCTASARSHSTQPLLLTPCLPSLLPSRPGLSGRCITLSVRLYRKHVVPLYTSETYLQSHKNQDAACLHDKHNYYCVLQQFWQMCPLCCFGPYCSYHKAPVACFQELRQNSLPSMANHTCAKHAS